MGTATAARRETSVPVKAAALRYAGPLLIALLFGAALWFIHRELTEYNLKDIERALAELPAWRIVLAACLTALSYFILTGYDSLALRYIEQVLPYRRTALASFVGYVFSYNIGLSILGGSATRYRLYSSWGLSTYDIARIVAFCALSFWVGVFTVGGAAFVIEPLPLPDFLHLPFESIRPVGIILLVVVGLYIMVTLLRRPIRFRTWELPPPTPRLTAAQIVVSALDWLVAALVLFVLLPGTDISYPHFLGIYLLGQLAGVISHVPGGLGVFETVLIYFLSPTVPTTELLASLVAYRAVYYVLPLIVASALLGLNEIRLRRKEVAELAETLNWVRRVVPSVLGLSTFVGGVILLLSGATPAEVQRLHWLRDFVPLPVVEVSHLAGSLAGVALLLLARGLQRRIDVAYYLAVILLPVGIVASLLKGFDYEEATALALMLMALIPARGEFYRRSSLLTHRFSLGWMVAVSLALAGCVWLMSFSYRHVELSNELWWQFAFLSDAPRSLRATFGAVVLALSVAVAKLLRPGVHRPTLPTPPDFETARTIIATVPETTANLALLGDKAFLFSDKGTAFIMYAVQRRSWVAMGDPIGPESERPELAWRFRELCERHGGWPVFYEVRPGNLPLYLDLGLPVLKLGEEGRVPLESFTLEGSAAKGLRAVRNRHEKEGSIFQMIPPEELEAHMPRLREISDSWLAHKNTKEKGFSLGFFAEDYIRYFPIATVWREGRMVAFANVWVGAGKEEISIDLMRYQPEEVAHGVMDYLFVRLMLWGQQEGYRWFNLGMAPMSGLEDRPFAPLWQRLGAFVFRHGEHFYNFQGLRNYKDKFHPVWEPRYLACPGGIALPTIFANLATLAAGGVTGVFGK